MLSLSTQTKTNFVELLPRWGRMAFTQLISYGVHLGHSLANTLNFCAWMVQGRRKGIFLIDLFKFVYMFRAGLFVLESVVRARSPVWFVNLNKLSSLFVKFPAMECGEYWVVENWMRGLISNYFVLRKSFLKTVNKPFPIWNRKSYLKNTNFSYWGFTRKTWPRLIFVSNVLHSYGPCHEAHRLNIPSLGITDTNTPHKIVSIAIPANDEAATALAFYNTLVSSFILYVKYAFVHNWYMGCLDETMFSFENWWEALPARRPNYSYFKPNVLNFNFDHMRYMISAFETQFLQDLWQQKQLEGFRFLTKTKALFSSFFLLDYIKRRKKFLKALTASWTMSTFGFSFLRPRFRRGLFSKSFVHHGKKSLLFNKNLSFFLKMPRLSRFYFRKIARRLYRSRQPRFARRFFYKFFGLSAIFFLLRQSYFFSPRFNDFPTIKIPYFKGGVRFPWFKYSSSLRRNLPASYRRIALRPRSSWRFKRELLRTQQGIISRGLGYGFTNPSHQIPREWSRQSFLLKYINSLGLTKQPWRVWKRVARSSSLSSLTTLPRVNVSVALTKTLSFLVPGPRASLSLQLIGQFMGTYFAWKNKLVTYWDFSKNAKLRELIGRRSNKRFTWGASRFKHPVSLDYFSFFFNFNFYPKLFTRRSSPLRDLARTFKINIKQKKQRWFNYV